MLRFILALIVGAFATAANAQPATTQPNINNTVGPFGTGKTLGAVTTSLGSDATGDIYFRNSSGVLTRLPIGTNGQALQVTTGLPAWASLSGAGTVTSVTCFGTAITSSGTCTTTGQIPGIASSTPASAGNVGEIISSCVASGSAVSLTAGAPINVTSISLTPGDWTVEGSVSFTTTSTTSVTLTGAAISGTSNTFPTPPNNTAPFGGGGLGRHFFPAAVPTAGSFYLEPTGEVPVTVASATTIFLVAQGSFTVSTLTAFGCIVARRAR
jgi:hypothetical protein